MTDRVVERGRLKVDARRAALKLKDHVLGDPSTWLCEIVRAAHGSGARRVDIRYDADDLFVRLDGSPWPTDVLDRAAIGADASEPADDRRIRRFALGAIASLGDDVRRVTVFVRGDKSDRVVATRLDRRSLATEKAKSEAIRGGPKDGGSVDSICLHVERQLDLEMLGRVFGLAEPRDVVSLEHRVRPGAVEIAVNGRVLVPRPEPATLLRLPIQAPYGAHLELSASFCFAPSAVFVESGIELSVHPLWPWSSWAARSVDGVSLPVRVVVHADVLPTNVSRTKVHDDVVAEIGQAAFEALPALVELARGAIATALDQQDEARAGQLISALVAFAVVLTDAPRGSEPTLDRLWPLLELPLLVDACGRRRSPRELSLARRVYAREDKTALPPHYAPLTRYVFATGEEPVPTLLARFRARPYAEIARRVEDGLGRRRRALEAAPAPFDVQVGPGHLIVHRVRCVEGFDVAIAIAPHDVEHRTIGVIRVFVDGHPLETIVNVPLPGVPIVDVAIAGAGSLGPAPGYDGVERDAGFDRAMALVPRLVAEAIAGGAPNVAPERLGDLRAIIAGHCVVSPTGEASAILEAIPAWPIVGAAAPMRLSVLASIAAAHGGLRWVSPDEASAFRVQTGTYFGLAPVLVLDARDLELLSNIFPERLVHYGGWLARTPSTKDDMVTALERQMGAGAPIYTFMDETVPLVVAPWNAPLVVRMHRGSVVSVSTQLPEGASCAVVVDEDYLLPGTGEPRVGLPPIVKQAQKRLVEAILANPSRVADGPWMPAYDLLADAARALSPNQIAALRRAPIFRLLVEGCLQRASADAVVGRFPSGPAIPIVAPRLETYAQTTALVAEGAERRLFRALVHRSLRELAPASSTDTLRDVVSAPAAPPVDPSPPTTLRNPSERRVEPDVVAHFARTAAPDRTKPVVEPSITDKLVEAARHLPLPPGTIFLLGSDARPVRYEASRRAIFVNPSHPAVKALLSRGDATSIVAAALSEVNRVVTEVPDIAEVRALERLIDRA